MPSLQVCPYRGVPLYTYEHVCSSNWIVLGLHVAARRLSDLYILWQMVSSCLAGGGYWIHASSPSWITLQNTSLTHSYMQHCMQYSLFLLSSYIQQKDNQYWSFLLNNVHCQYRRACIVAIKILLAQAWMYSCSTVLKINLSWGIPTPISWILLWVACPCCALHMSSHPPPPPRRFHCMGA
jgi:hypothetical protein